MAGAGGGGTQREPTRRGHNWGWIAKPRPIPADQKTGSAISISTTEKEVVRCGGAARRRASKARMDLKFFVHRANVMALYRECLRTARRAPVQARADLCEMARQEFRDSIRLSDGNTKDAPNAKMLLQQGRNRLQEIKMMVDMVK